MCCSVVPPETITHKASDAVENLQLCVVQFFHPTSSCTTTYISADVHRITLNASCMTTSGGRTKQLELFCRIIGFKSDFLSFIVVELIRFFRGALQLSRVTSQGRRAGFCGSSKAQSLDSPCAHILDQTQLCMFIFLLVTV